MSFRFPDPGDRTLLLRTDFNAPEVWLRVVAGALAEQPSPLGGPGFQADLEPVEDPTLADLEPGDLVALAAAGEAPTFVFVADRQTFAAAEPTLLVLDLDQEFGDPGQSFRVILSEVWSVENNLRLANMDFEDFQFSALAGDGIHRGFED